LVEEVEIILFAGNQTMPLAQHAGDLLLGGVHPCGAEAARPSVIGCSSPRANAPGLATCEIGRGPYIEAMKIPREVPVMTLPNATLFPQALLPLYIFEPRYRQMLADALHSHRMFTVAMQKPGWTRESPAPVAGLGLIRVSVGHKDGTSHLIVQGLTRVELQETVRYKPYRVQRIRPISVPPCDSVRVDALMAKVRELLDQRIRMGLPFPFPVMSAGSPSEAKSAPPPSFSAKEILGYLDSIADPEQAADLVSCAVLPGASERQAILETVNVEERLRRLIQFLLREIKNNRKNKNP
jgi:ATP-dependent Lon protease